MSGSRDSKRSTSAPRGALGVRLPMCGRGSALGPCRNAQMTTAPEGSLVWRGRGPPEAAEHNSTLRLGTQSASCAVPSARANREASCAVGSGCDPFVLPHRREVRQVICVMAAPQLVCNSPPVSEKVLSTNSPVVGQQISCCVSTGRRSLPAVTADAHGVRLLVAESATCPDQHLDE